jgi:hypothetical protein
MHQPITASLLLSTLIAAARGGDAASPTTPVVALVRVHPDLQAPEAMRAVLTAHGQ